MEVQRPDGRRGISESPVDVNDNNFAQLKALNELNKITKTSTECCKNLTWEAKRKPIQKTIELPLGFKSLRLK